MCRKPLFLFFALIFIVLSASNARAEFCCNRYGLFLPIEMPPEQEKDCTNMISAGHYDALLEGGVNNCPVKWREQSYQGTLQYDRMLEALSRSWGNDPDPDFFNEQNLLLSMHYAWEASLALHKINKKVEGQWVEGYQGKPNYEPGYVKGEWTLQVKLVNIHFNEVVEQGSIGFTGSCSAEGGEAMKDLVRAYFNPIHDTVYRYEQVPTEATLEFEQEPLEAGEETTVTVNLYDDWGRAPKSWQRIVVQTREGEILNGVKCRDNDKAWAFKCDSGRLQIKYKPPEDCEDKTETFTIYNSCTWGQESFRPKGMDMTEKNEVISEREAEIKDLQPSSCTIDPEKEKLNTNEAMTIRLLDFVEPNGLELRPGEKIMVKVDEGTILNGKKQGEYTVFPIGDGTVNVAYEAPDKCGLDKDKLTVHNVCEDKEKGTLEADEQIAEKSLSIKKVRCDLIVHIHAIFQWKDDAQNNTINGFGSMTIQGSMKFDQQNQTPFVKRYIPDNLKVTWRFKETQHDYTGNPDCPDLVQEIMEGGSASLPDPKFQKNTFLEIRKFGEIFGNQDLPVAVPIPPEAKQQMTDQYLLALPGAKQTIKGKRRKSSMCTEQNCPCKEYKNVKKGIWVGSVFIQGKLNSEKNIQGKYHWVARGNKMRDLKFQVNEMGDKVEFKPRVLKKPEGKLINVSVSWDIKVNK